MRYSHEVNLIWVDMASLENMRQVDSAWLFSLGLEA